MIKRGAATLMALSCLATAGCTVNRYPIALPWSPEDGAGLSCAELTVAAGEGRRLQTQIEAIAAGDPAARAERPRLYSTDRSDADRAVQARLSAIEAQGRAKGCN